jgi:hypothetical protein
MRFPAGRSFFHGAGPGVRLHKAIIRKIAKMRIISVASKPRTPESQAPRAPLPIWSEQGLAQDQEPGGAWRAAVPAVTVTGLPDHLATALYFATCIGAPLRDLHRRTCDESERIRLAGVARHYRAMAMAESPSPSIKDTRKIGFTTR